MRTQARTIIVAAAVAFVLAALPTLAGSRIEQELELAPGGSFTLDTDVGTVEVVGSSRTGARVVITSRSDDLESRFDFSFESSGGVAEVRCEKKGSKSSWFSWGRGQSVKFEIEVPHQTEVDIDTAGGSITAESIDGDVRLDTSGGSIVAENIGGEVVADTSGGSIAIEDVDGDVNADTSGGSIAIDSVRGDVRADTSGGSIAIEGVTGDINADTSGGSIAIDGAEGHVKADTSGGDVEVRFAPGNSSGGTLSTSGGSIRVYVDPSVNLDIDASASGGSVVSNVPVTVQGKVGKSTLRGRLGGGGDPLKLRASGGKIRIEPL